MLANISTHLSSLSKKQEICVYKKSAMVIFSFGFIKKKNYQDADTLHKVRKRAMGRGLAGLEIFPVFHKLGEGTVRNRDMTTGFEG